MKVARNSECVLHTRCRVGSENREFGKSVLAVCLPLSCVPHGENARARNENLKQGLNAKHFYYRGLDDYQYHVEVDLRHRIQ